jgi:hypothetical protein
MNSRALTGGGIGHALRFSSITSAIQSLLCFAIAEHRLPVVFARGAGRDNETIQSIAAAAHHAGFVSHAFRCISDCNHWVDLDLRLLSQPESE